MILSRPFGLLVFVIVFSVAGARASAWAEMNPSAPAAAASPSNVGLLAPPPGDPILAEAVTRLRSELRAAGRTTHVIDCAAPETGDLSACGTRASAVPASIEPRPASVTGEATREPLPEAPAAAAAPTEPSAPPAANAAPRATTTISLGREDNVVTIEVVARLADGSKNFRLVYVPAKAGGSDPTLLAVRAVELLHDVDLDVARSAAAARRSAAATDQDDAETPASIAGSGRWRLTVAAAALAGRNGLGPSVAPALGAAFTVGAHLSLLATIAGPFFNDLSGSSADASTGGTATTRQELGLIGARADTGRGSVRPFATVAAGLYHLRASGTSTDISRMTVGSTLWAPLLAGGVGVAGKVAPWVALWAEAGLIFTGPAASVTIQGTEVGRVGAPSFLFQVGAWLFDP